jgi:hypothetical protein
MILFVLDHALIIDFGSNKRNRWGCFFRLMGLCADAISVDF